MNVLNFVFIGLIFLSLGAIVFIYGRNIKKIRETSFRSKRLGRQEPQQKTLSRWSLSGILQMVGNGMKNFFVFVVERIIKHAKKLLHLIHFWLIKIKKKKNKDEEIDEIEAKRELLSEEQENLNKIMQEDLGSSEGDVVEADFVSKEFNNESDVEKDLGRVSFPKKRLGVREQEVFISRKIEPGIEFSEELVEKEQKIESFFAEKKEADFEKVREEDSQFDQSEHQEEFFQEEDTETEPPKNFFAKIFSKFSPKKKEDVQEDDLEGGAYDRSFNGDEFSDGVVRVEKNGGGKLVDDFSAGKASPKISSFRHEADADEALGVDRKILEKKILQKISKDPKDIENYRQLGELYIKMKNFSDASEAFKYILQVSPRDADAKRKIEKIKLLKRIS